MNFFCNNFQDHHVEIRFDPPGASFRFPAEKQISDVEYGGDQTTIFAEPGQTVQVVVVRSVSANDPNRTDFSYISLAGYLFDAN